MKLSKEEMIAKINDKVADVDLAIELIEDITDSMDAEVVEDTASEELKAELEKVTLELADLKMKYKERFLKSEEMVEEVEETEDEVEETEEPRKFEDLIDEDGGIK